MLLALKGEPITLLGPSGSGKTTTMRAIAGLLTPTSGSIAIDGRDVTRVAADKRGIGLVFQSYALFPHLSAFKNVAFALRLQSMPEAAPPTLSSRRCLARLWYATQVPA